MDQELVTYHSGLEFVELPEHVHTAIVEFLAAVKAHRSGV
jgi:hypothetical protein